MTATAPEPTEPAGRSGSEDRNRTVYWVIGAVVVVLAVVGLITYSGKNDDQQAQAKAQELTQKFRRAGLPVPQDQDIITRSLGTDGGAVCDNPASALGKAVLNDQLTNGAAFAGRRVIIIDKRIVLGEALILQTYCPEKLKPYQDQISQFKTDDTLKK
jgi:hypothetical protein